MSMISIPNLLCSYMTQTFSVNIIPHTEENTSWSSVSKGDRVNIEFDVLARYVSRQLEERL